MSAVARMLDRAPAAPLPLEFWQGDAAAVRRALAALDQLGILISNARLSEIAEEYAHRRLSEARLALERFITSWGASE
jgi:hypothetical protein